ncbi:hypothetical protein BC936DRAFT_147521 [Jimgerdemannia flammicorona]|nr:hypothetical protein BC936DRAFT_147521 [Jimgerdemannia flammicorona]
MFSSNPIGREKLANTVTHPVTCTPYLVATLQRPVTANTNAQWRHDKFQPGDLNTSPSSLIITKAVNQAGSSIQSRLGGGLLTARGAAKKSGGTMIADRIGLATPPKVTTIKGVAGGKQTEFSIKGEAGPASIVITNLDPGAIADDVKTAFLELGDILTCTLRYDQAGRSIGTADIQFAQKASALAAIKKYDNAIADGRVLKVQLKTASAKASPVSGTTASYRAAAASSPRVQQETLSPASLGTLYSDRILSSSPATTITPQRRSVRSAPTFSVTFGKR